MCLIAKGCLGDVLAIGIFFINVIIRIKRIALQIVDVKGLLNFIYKIIIAVR